MSCPQALLPTVGGRQVPGHLGRGSSLATLHLLQRPRRASVAKHWSRRTAVTQHELASGTRRLCRERTTLGFTGQRAEELRERGASSVAAHPAIRRSKPRTRGKAQSPDVWQSTRHSSKQIQLENSADPVCFTCNCQIISSRCVACWRARSRCWPSGGGGAKSLLFLQRAPERKALLERFVSTTGGQC